MITIYLDHNVIDGFDKGETAYIDPLFADKKILLIVSLASVDEIFRGGDEARSEKNIESLKRLGVRYIHHDPDESHMSINELDYENMRDKWAKMQSEVGPLNDSYSQFINSLYRGNTPETIQEMDEAIENQVAWIKNNYDKFPSVKIQMDTILHDPQEYKELSRQALHLKGLLPFTPKEINNIQEKKVFWFCVDKLKSADNSNLQLIGESIENEIKSAKTISDQFTIVFYWLNFFGYYPDDLTKKNKARSNFSDATHAEYAIACDGLLTSDKKFAHRAAAAIGALELRTKVSSNATDLLHRIVAE